jgi:2-polyprenyl-3-methyl-5-hydroxy-6-metoxy-1,4-benzoquinol methylase
MNPVQLENVPCPLSCPENDDVVLQGHDKLHSLPGEFTVVKCRTCGLMRTNPRPTAESIGFYYPDNYGPYLGTQVEQRRPDQSHGIKNFLRPLVRRIFDSKSEALPDVRPGRLLEIGCASSSFLHKMAAGGWQVEGIEFSEKAAKAASELGHQVHIGSLENAPEPENQFDLIVGWMVLEHLHNPVGSLKKLHTWANSGAWLVLSVPNVDTLAFRLSQDKWYDLHLPNHLYHFSTQTLAKVLEAGGWGLEKIHHQRTVNNLIESAAYVAESKGWHRLSNWLHGHAARGGKWFYIQFPFAWVLSVFGQSGRMTVWARKHGEVDLPSGQESSGATARIGM